MGGIAFQFPSNGKVYSETYLDKRSVRFFDHKVSIPFKRESVFRAILMRWWTPEWNGFQFPSNGKVYSEADTGLEITPAQRARVSIPFKRESVFRDMIRQSLANRCLFQFPSNGKVYSEPVEVEVDFLLNTSFNSLQTGKCIQSSFISITTSKLTVSIPFKRESVFRDMDKKSVRFFDHKSFNSLQTGKCIQRY